MSHSVELEQLFDLMALGQQQPLFRCRLLTEVHGLPVVELQLGRQQADLPVVGLYAGVHGTERIGSQIVLAWLKHLLARLAWDQGLADLLQRVRLVSIPLVNPTGLVDATRANRDGIDLMRNAPVQAEGWRLWPLAGQKLSARLPWYQGRQLAAESRALFQSVTEASQSAPLMLAMDLHSGFGLRDRLWFPYAAHRRPLPHLAEAVALSALFNDSYPFHDFYKLEPQSLNYTTHGDLWDFLYQQACEQQQLLMPFTLEMGSWVWLRKNPRQLFDRLGLFHPILPHRLRRVVRRHWTLLEFLLRAAADHDHWLPQDAGQRGQLNSLGLARWYGRT